MVDSTSLKLMKTLPSSEVLFTEMNTEISNNFYKAGTHLGHKSIPLTEVKSWHSSMASYHLGIRDTITICNLQQTQKALSRAFYVLTQILENGGNILIVNTNPEFYKLSVNSMKFMEKNLPSSIFLNVSYCFYKWIGGTLTNYKQISKSIYCYLKFSQRCGKFCEKHNIDFVRYQKIKKCFQGYGFIKKDILNDFEKNSIIMSLQKKPDIIFIFNPGDNKNLIREANRLQIPIIACTDTSTSLKNNRITYPIPCNNTSVDFVLYLYKKLYKVFDFISKKEK